MQYVRDSIEEMYRIVAVVSLPQTAFTATGAGVKSSVLFLKKNTAEQTKKIKDTKQALRDSITKQQKLHETLNSIELKKEDELKALKGLENPKRLEINELKKTDAYRVWVKEVTDRYSEKIDDFRFRLGEMYEERKRKALDDYNIFMAIAEDIGYDATGRTTKINELDSITEELSKFIQAIDKVRK